MAEDKTVTNVVEQMPTLDKVTANLSRLSTLISIPLALLYVVLFLWHPIGVSYLIYALVLVLSAIAPAIIFGNKLEAGFIKRYAIFALLMLLPSVTYLFRFSDEVKAALFLAIPFIYSVFIVYTYHPKALQNFGALYMLQAPFVIFGQYFVRISEFLKKYRSNLLGPVKATSAIKRIMVGVAISIPFLFVFFMLFASADPTFGQAFADIIDSFVKIFFKDFATFVEFIFKIIVGIFVGAHLMVWHFYSWKDESELAHTLSTIKDFHNSEYKKNWDYITVFGFLFLIDLLFLVFVIAQLNYLFSGESNVIGSEAQFTYAQYARRGFGELVFAAAIVYAILFVVNIKTALVTNASRILFGISTSLLAVFTLMIGASSMYRLMILQDIYGFTDIRTWAIVGTFLVTALVISTIVLVWFKNYVKNSSLAMALGIMGLIGFYIFFPMDYYLGSSNLNRYEKTGQIDLPYMLNLNDEALPVLIQLVEDSKIPESGEIAILENLENRYKEYKENYDWRMYSPSLAYQYSRVGELVKDNKVTVREDLIDLLSNYYETIQKDGFDRAYDLYWSVSTRKLDLDELDAVKITGYKFISVPTFSENRVLNYENSVFDGGNYSYWDGELIDVQVTYEDDFWGGSNCINETLFLKLEDGEWKIIRSDGFVLGNFRDGEVDYYNEYDDNSHLEGSYCY